MAFSFTRFRSPKETNFIALAKSSQSNELHFKEKNLKSISASSTSSIHLQQFNTINKQKKEDKKQNPSRNLKKITPFACHCMYSYQVDVRERECEKH